MRTSSSALGSAALVLALGPLACGPSFQAVYEGNARFERCYALEENPQVPMPEKAACWREWSERYTYGQTRDRVHYATARYVALTEARSLPTDEALMMAAPGETPRVSVITAPAPTSALAPPPKVLEAASPRGVSRRAEGAPGTLPAAPCVDACGDGYRACTSGCGEPPASGRESPTGSCAGCTVSYRACMRDCFK